MGDTEGKRTPTELYLENMRLIPFVLKKKGIYQYSRNVIEEFEGDARVALWNCAIKYKAEMGYTFSTYAVRGIENAFLMSCRHNFKVYEDKFIPFSSFSRTISNCVDDSDKAMSDIVDKELSEPSNIEDALDVAYSEELVYKVIDGVLDSIRGASFNGMAKKDIRNIFILHYIHDRSVKQLSELYHVKPHRISVLFYKLKERFKTVLTDELNKRNEGEARNGGTDIKRGVGVVIG